MSFLAIDLGTSFIKGAVLDLDAGALQLSRIQRVPFPEPLPHLPPLLCEVDPNQIIAATRDLIARLLAYAPDCEGVVMCSQMQGLVLMDQAGRALSNYISWRDQRALMPHRSGGGTFFDVLARRVSREQHRKMGNGLRPSLPLCALFWLAEEEQLPSLEATPATPADFLIAHLCGVAQPPGAKGHGIEPTLASVHGALDLETMQWQNELHASLGLGKLRWPQLRRAGEIAGYADLGSRRVPFYMPVGDQPCALAGALLQEGELSINISTGSQVSLIAPTLQFGDYQTRPFFDNQHLKLITHIPAGRSLDLLVSLLGELADAQGVKLQDPWAFVERAAEQTGATDLQVNLAFFASAAGDRGAISNIHEGNLTVGHLFRAAFENMADNYCRLAQRLSPERAWRRIVFSGGLAQLAPLRNLVCARLQSEYRMCPSSEDTLVGLFALALAASRRTPTVRAAIAELADKRLEN